jgi:outer membrane protein assembly factor BamA
VWQQQGYFLAAVAKPTADELHDAPLERTVAITVDIHAGQAYRLNGIEIRNATQFAATELRPLFPIQQGDIFDTHKIQQGIENLRKAYGARGFINFVAVPATQIDETHALITLLVEVEEGKQFRIGKVEVLGLDPVLSEKLLRESGLEPGKIFDASLLDKFFERNKLILPSDAKPKENARRVLDESHGTVDITMDFRVCPQAAQR